MDKPRGIAITPGHLMPIQSACMHWRLTAPLNVTADDLLEPETFKHVSQSVGLKSGDLIDAIAIDGTWSANYEVIDVGPQYAKLFLRNFWDKREIIEGKIMSDEDVEDAGYKIKWVGANYVVLRLSDNETMEKGFKTPETAKRWLAESLKKIAA